MHIKRQLFNANKDLFIWFAEFWNSIAENQIYKSNVKCLNVAVEKNQIKLGWYEWVTYEIGIRKKNHSIKIVKKKV